jgi:hypothetical protein
LVDFLVFCGTVSLGRIQLRLTRFYSNLGSIFPLFPVEKNKKINYFALFFSQTEQETMTLLSPARMVQLWLWLFQLGVVIGGKLQIPAGITREEFFKQNPDLSPTKLGELDPSAAASASFAHSSYEAYRNAQIDATAKKTGGEGGRYHAAAGGSGTGEGTRLVSFAHRESVEYLAKELTQLGAIPTDGTGFGLCHAVRFGHEVT